MSELHDEESLRRLAREQAEIERQTDALVLRTLTAMVTAAEDLKSKLRRETESLLEEFRRVKRGLDNEISLAGAERQRTRREAEQERDQILAAARAEAEEIVEAARREREDVLSEVRAMEQRLRAIDGQIRAALGLDAAPERATPVPPPPSPPEEAAAPAPADVVFEDDEFQPIAFPTIAAGAPADVGATEELAEPVEEGASGSPDDAEDFEEEIVSAPPPAAPPPLPAAPPAAPARPAASAPTQPPAAQPPAAAPPGPGPALEAPTRQMPAPRAGRQAGGSAQSRAAARRRPVELVFDGVPGYQQASAIERAVNDLLPDEEVEIVEFEGGQLVLSVQATDLQGLADRLVASAPETLELDDCAGDRATFRYV